MIVDKKEFRIDEQIREIFSSIQAGIQNMLYADKKPNIFLNSISRPIIKTGESIDCKLKEKVFHRPR